MVKKSATRSASLRGNKNGVGHGRPPNEGQSTEELIQLGKDLMQWMKEQDANPKSNVVHLSEFYSEVKDLSPSQWDAIRKRDCFLQYYEKAIIWMGKRTLKNKDLSPSYGNRFL